MKSYFLSYFKKYLPHFSIGSNASLSIYDKNTPLPNLDKPLLKEYQSIKRYSYFFDESLLKLPFGLTGALRLVPFFGNYVVLILNTYILYKIYTFTRNGNFKLTQVRLKNYLLMLTNVAVDFGLGLIPVVGFFTTVVVKCNTRNMNILYDDLNGVTSNPLNEHQPKPIEVSQLNY